MITAYLLIYAPIVLFVVAFLYETWLSIRRLSQPGSERRLYVDTTWETTHTLLVFAVVMMLMLFTRSIDQLASLIFWPAFLAISALLVRGGCYIYLFYIKPAHHKQSWVDWLFMASHIVAALLLVATVMAFTYFLIHDQPVANLQFIPSFLVGLGVIIMLVCGPLIYMYGSARKK